MFAKNLKYLRAKRGIEQIELARMLGKKSGSSISSWESGTYTPKIGTLAKIADIFNVDLDDLMNIDLSDASPRNMSHFHRAAPNEWLAKLWRKYEAELSELGLHRISPHGFRHSQATLLYELGIDPKDAQHRLRHKNLKTTMDIYTHISKDRKAGIADELDAFSSRGTTLGTKVIQFPTQKERESLLY